MDYPGDLDIDLYSGKPISRREYPQKKCFFMQRLDHAEIPKKIGFFSAKKRLLQAPEGFFVLNQFLGRSLILAVLL